MKILNTLFALVFAFASAEAFACSYDPQLQKNRNSMLAVALDQIGVEMNDITSIDSQLVFRETKPTPMCPDEIRYISTYTVTWATGKDLAMPKPCSSTATVVKTVNYEKSRAKPKITVTSKATRVVCAP